MCDAKGRVYRDEHLPRGLHCLVHNVYAICLSMTVTRAPANWF